jgi:hypothetical protein
MHEMTQRKYFSLLGARSTEPMISEPMTIAETAALKLMAKPMTNVAMASA